MKKFQLISIVTLIVIIIATFFIQVPINSCKTTDICGITLEGGCWKETTCKVIGHQTLFHKIFKS